MMAISLGGLMAIMPTPGCALKYTLSRAVVLCMISLACGPAGAGENCEPTVFYPDADGDGFGRTGSVGAESCLKLGTSNLQIPVGYSLNSLDCAPDDSRAFPGQTIWQMLPVFGASRDLWDFNCDGVETLQYPVTPTVCPSGPSCGSTPLGAFWTGTTTAPACGQTGRWVTQCAVLSGACTAITEQRVQGCL